MTEKMQYSHTVAVEPQKKLNRPSAATDAARDDHTKWSKSERGRQMYHISTLQKGQKIQQTEKETKKKWDSMDTVMNYGYHWVGREV